MSDTPFDPETFDPWEDRWPEHCFQSKGMLNAYRCEVCGRQITTIDLVSGTTPYLVGCRAPHIPSVLPRCKGLMASAFYRIPQNLPWTTHEWYRPTKEEVAAMDPERQDHFWGGGLEIRAVTP